MLGRLAVLASMSGGLFLLVFGFRWIYFGSLFPQPVIAKSGALSWSRLWDGIQYLITGMHPATVDAATQPMESITMERGKMLLPAVLLPDFHLSSVTKF